MSVSVVCFKWGSAYRAEHVEKLGAMLARNFTSDYEFVCVSDDESGIQSADRIIPMWDDLAHMGRRWRRLKLFSTEIQSQLRERIVQIDLDVVITGSLDALFDRDAPFVIWDGGRAPLSMSKLDRQPVSASLWMCRRGEMTEVWESFDERIAADLGLTYGLAGSDSAWINYIVDNPSRWTSQDGIYRFSTLEEGNLPENARTVFFTGLHDPSDAELQEKHDWIGANWRTESPSVNPFILPQRKQRSRRRGRRNSSTVRTGRDEPL